jgi:hypothetical protein
MSTIISRSLLTVPLLLVVLGISACRDQEVPSYSYSKLRKGNATLQLEAQRNGSGDLSVTLTSIVDLPFVDIRTKVEDQWIELVRMTNLRAGEPRSINLSGAYDKAESIWASSTGGEHRWAAHTGIVTGESSSLSSLSLKALEFSPKLKPEFSGKKIME